MCVEGDIMKCRWCNGTGFQKEFECEHCDNGVITAPPENVTLSDTLSSEAVSKLAFYYTQMPRDSDQFESQFHTFLDTIADSVLEEPRDCSNEDRVLFYNYWCDAYRDCTLGEYIRYFSAYLEKKYPTKCTKIDLLTTYDLYGHLDV